MENSLLILMSITSLFVIYWVIYGQKNYNNTFRDYFHQQNEIKENLTLKKDKKNKEK